MDTETVKALKKILEENPKSVEIRLHLGEVLLEQALLNDAKKQFDKVLGLEPSNLKAKYGLGKMLFKEGKLEETRKLFEDIIWKEPNNERVLLSLAELFERQNKFEDALKKYDKAYEVNPNSTVLLKIQELEEKLNRRIPAGPLNRSEYMEVSPIEKPNIRFEDVGGMEIVKNKIRELLINPFKNPELYKAYGKKAGGGILLYGPPGCGKTLIAKATAGEVDAGFINISLSDVLDMWLGESEKRLDKFFETARKHAPSVIFIDEIDAIGRKRSSIPMAGQTIVNELLSQMDGVEKKNDQVLIIAATNTPWDVDVALRRPGRFDHLIFVHPPDLNARIEILKIHLKNKPLDKINYDLLAKKTKEYSGADLKKVCEEATSYAMQRATKSGKIENINMKDFDSAVKNTHKSTTEWYSVAKNYAKYSNESKMFDDLNQEIDDEIPRFVS